LSGENTSKLVFFPPIWAIFDQMGVKPMQFPQKEDGIETY
jgi:hypothetical protein